MNRCSFTGNLTADPELRHVKGKEDGKDIPVLNFQIGVNDRRTGESTFPRCEAWGSGAELIAKFFRKGDLIRVYTRLVTDTWPKDPDDPESEMNYRDKYRVYEFEFPETNNKPVKAFIHKLADVTDLSTDELWDIFKKANGIKQAEPAPEETPPQKGKRDSKSEPAKTRDEAKKRTRKNGNAASPPPPPPEDDGDGGEEGEDDIPFDEGSYR